MNAVSNAREELEERLRLRAADRRRGLVVACDVGWWPLIERLDADLAAVVPRYRFRYVKEKFGRLDVMIDLPRFTSRRSEEAAWALVRAAESASERVCERCGAAGTRERNERGWWSTRCGRCRVGGR